MSEDNTQSVPLDNNLNQIIQPIVEESNNSYLNLSTFTNYISGTKLYIIIGVIFLGIIYYLYTHNYFSKTKNKKDKKDKLTDNTDINDDQIEIKDDQIEINDNKIEKNDDKIENNINLQDLDIVQKKN